MGPGLRQKKAHICLVLSHNYNEMCVGFLRLLLKFKPDRIRVGMINSSPFKEEILMRILVLLFLSIFTSFIFADEDSVLAPLAPVTLPKSPGQATARTCDSYGEKLFNSCRYEVDAAIINSTSVLGQAALQNESDVEQTESGAGAAANASAMRQAQAGYCQAALDQCKQFCEQAKKYHMGQSPPQREKAQKALSNGEKRCGAILAVIQDSNISAASLANHARQMDDTAESLRGQGGGMGKLMSPLLGAGAALGVMCLMGRGICEGDDDEGEGAASSSTENGPVAEEDIDCNKAENHMYAKCEQHYIHLCQANTNGTGCNEFNNLYCGMNLTTSTDDSEDAASIKVNNELPLVSGKSGVGSTYCQYQVSVDYCKDDGTESCPSCRQLEQSKSPVCQANPATCLPGWTQTQLKEAQNYCPTDPMFMIADTSTDNGTATTKEEGSSSSGTVTSDDGETTSDTASGLPSGSGDGVPPETTSLDKIAGAGNTSVGSYGSSEAFNPYGDLATYSVGSAFGPSLFAHSSKVYNEKCEMGLIDNCGPREGLGAASAEAAMGGTN